MDSLGPKGVNERVRTLCAQRSYLREMARIKNGLAIGGAGRLYRMNRSGSPKESSVNSTASM